MSLLFSLWWPLFLGVGGFAYIRLHIPLMMASPSSGWAWNTVGLISCRDSPGITWRTVSSAHLYLIQIADFASSLGISLLIAIVNALVVDFLTLPLFSRSRRVRLSSPAIRPALRGDLLAGNDTLLWSDSGLEPPGSMTGPGCAAPVEYRAEAQKLGQRQGDSGRVYRIDRSGPGTTRATGPDRLAGDSVPLRLHHGRPGRHSGRTRKTGPIVCPQMVGQRVAEPDGGYCRPPSFLDRTAGVPMLGAPPDTSTWPALMDKARRVSAVQRGDPVRAEPPGAPILSQNASGPVRRVLPVD